MFERFTDRARKSVVWAQEEARQLNHHHIGTEHLLLGLLREGEGIAARALDAADVQLEATREAVELRVGRGSSAAPGHVPFTPRAKKVLELALREALRLEHTYIGTEHVLLGLLEEGEGVAAQILMVGADGGLGQIQSNVVEIMAGALPSRVASELRERMATISAAAARAVASSPIGPNDVIIRLEAIEARLSSIERLLRGPRDEDVS